MNVTDDEVARWAPLVKQVALRYAFALPPGLEVDDLIAYGSYGLLEALERYDAGRGVPFEAYARARIQGAILDGLRSFQPLPEPARRELRSLGQAQEALFQRLGREPTVDELAEAMGKTPAEVEALERMAGMLSMLSMHEFLGVEPAHEETPEAAALEKELKERLAAALAQLTPKERRVLELVYYHDLNLSECAAVLGVTPSRCWQLHRRAVLRLRTLFEAEEVGEP
jgi:RNA polymerase sigma factor for flagellar operon FliA